MSLPISAPVDVIAYALCPEPAPAADGAASMNWQQALQAVAKDPAMQALTRLQVQHTAELDAHSSCSSHESAYAQALGWSMPSDVLPFAAQAAQQLQLSCPADHGWAFVDLVHAEFNQGQMFYALPRDVTQVESDGFLQAMHGYFAEDGIHLHTLAPGRFLAHATCLKQLPSVSLERVLHTGTHALSDPDLLATQSPAQRLLRRLQNEMQMLLYTHPLNEQRQQPLNSFWLSGTGDLPVESTSNVRLHTDLRDSFLAQDPLAWTAAWQQLAHTLFHSGLQPGHGLVLCGTQRCLYLQAGQRGWWQDLKNRLLPVSLAGLLS